MTNINAQETAATTLYQLGGHRFVAMTGAKDFGHNPDGSLQFRIGRNATSANRVKITLDRNDTYTVVFTKISFSKKTFETKEKVINEIAGIYSPQLKTHFENVTGLYTSL